jgi:plastocyanin
MNLLASSLSLVAAALVAAGPTASPADTAAAPAPAATVTIADFAFKPATVTIHAGQSVLWVNKDGDAHTATAVDKSFDSGGLDTNEHWQHTFTKPGRYAYICALHPYMKGTIVVTAGAPPTEAPQ